jgi:hypothetical protein
MAVSDHDHRTAGTGGTPDRADDRAPRSGSPPLPKAERDRSMRAYERNPRALGLNLRSRRGRR